MRKDDEKIKHILQSDTVKMDDEQKKRLDLLLNNLPEKEIVIDKSKRHGSAWKSVFAMLAVIIILPNINPSVAYAMYDLPLIGKIFEVVTVRNYRFEDEKHEVDIKAPKISIDEEAINKVNDESLKFVNKIVEEFEQDFQEESYQAIYVDYEVVIDTEEWFTLKLNVSEIRASSNEYYKFYHIDKKTGRCMNLSDLFADKEYAEAINENIREQMISQNDAYQIESENRKIKSDQNFYFDKEGNIVIVYNKYEVAPGSMGCPEFVIDKKIYEKYLK